MVPPKSSILIGFSIINHPFWGTSIFGNIHLGQTLTVYPNSKNIILGKLHQFQHWFGTFLGGIPYTEPMAFCEVDSFCPMRIFTSLEVDLMPYMTYMSCKLHEI